MKHFLAVLACMAALALATSNAQTCNTDQLCTSSIACARESGDFNCRCDLFYCAIGPACGGGCITDAQCRDWSGMPSCVCDWWALGECVDEGEMQKPGYKAYATVKAAIKKHRLEYILANHKDDPRIDMKEVEQLKAEMERRSRQA